MEIFLDTADLGEISRYGNFIDGVTTNPSLIAKSQVKDFKKFVVNLSQLVSGPVSVEVVADKYDGMLAEARKLAKIRSNICIKLPCTLDGFRLCKELSSEGISTNMTLCFSPTQALLAAKCGATYVSPFIGRLEDAGHDGLALVEEIVSIFDMHGYETKVLAASVRSLQHVIQSAMLGAGAVTMPPHILRQCFDHPLTDKGLEIFARDCKK